jgi:hypothetical protein
MQCKATITGLLSLDFGELVVAVVAMTARSQDTTVASVVDNPGLRGSAVQCSVG